MNQGDGRRAQGLGAAHVLEAETAAAQASGVPEAGAGRYARGWSPRDRMSDRLFLKLRYRKELGVWPDLEHPRTFNEKVTWRILNDRSPLLTQVTDKAAVRRFVSSRVGERYLTRLYALVDRTADLDWDSLPAAFVMKATHGCEWTRIVRSKDALDRRQLLATADSWLRSNYYRVGREWAYKDIPPRILVEELLSEEGQLPKDYKFFCFHGEPRVIQVDFDRFIHHRQTMYFPNWRRVPADGQFPPGPNIPPPERLPEMLQVAAALARPFDFIRVDMYFVEGRVYVGELTCYPGNGTVRFHPASFDAELGSYWRLSSGSGGAKPGNVEPHDE
jgi:hypothetical protein